jgi:hypothetical protein
MILILFCSKSKTRRIKESSKESYQEVNWIKENQEDRQERCQKDRQEVSCPSCSRSSCWISPSHPTKASYSQEKHQESCQEGCQEISCQEENHQEMRNQSLTKRFITVRFIFYKKLKTSSLHLTPNSLHSSINHI